MSAVLQNQQVGLNPMQLHLVSMLNFNNSKSAVQRLKKKHPALSEMAGLLRIYNIIVR